MNKLKLLTLIILTVLFANFSAAQSITPWTEQNSTLGLGYPVPIPVNTPEPFDGFRTYEGLFAKHQELALNNPYITGQIVGQTVYDRDIWAYVLSDEDNNTKFGVKEGAMLINGGIHAREWQSPETLTQIITTFNDNSEDNSFYQYLLENATIITIPSNNIDGFLQTQRFPRENWYSNNIGPRDGRMRRKNLLNTDEVLTTQNDFLNGVDLNRNNNPYWATTANLPNPRSSNDPTSIVYHGPFVHSEPETLARLAAADLVDADQLRVYTDVHSFSLVHFSGLTFNQNRNAIQTRMLGNFSRFHRQLPGARNYVDLPSQAGFGIGSTDEYFATTYEIPSWTLEIEPSNIFQNDVHPELPGYGADYGGFANNGHDGFILPDSEIKRVRENLAEAFMVAWYGQAGPPSITQMRIIDKSNNSIVFDAEWDVNNSGSRDLFTHAYDELLSGHDYSLLVRFDKPMRYRDNNGTVTSLPGQTTILNPVIQATHDGETVDLNLTNHRWINEKSSNWESYGFYQDDTVVVDFNIDPSINAADDAELTWRIITTDMVGQNTDANPASIITWSGGTWINYEDTNGNPSINGGFDTTIVVTVSNQDAGPEMTYPLTALYFDPGRSGEGFNIEILDNNNSLMQWYTYDENGGPQWLLATNPIAATNALFFPTVLSASGGVFGPDFDPAAIELSASGSVEMIFSTVDLGGGNISHVGNMKYTYPDGRKFRTTLQPVAAATGIYSLSELGNVDPPEPALSAASLIGSWFDPTRNGEGFHIQETVNGNAVMLWYSYGLNGGQDWFIGSGGVVTELFDEVNISFNEVYQVRGGVFGADFNANNIVPELWGSVELNLQCTSGRFDFNALDSEYGSGSYSVVPITRPVANNAICE